MQQLGTDLAFVQEQYSDTDRFRIRIETHARYSQGETERVLDDVVDALCLSPGLRVLDIGCGAGGWHTRIAATGAALVGIDLMPGMLQEATVAAAVLEPTPVLQAAEVEGAHELDSVLRKGS